MNKVILTLQEYNKLILSVEKNKTIAMDTIEENLKLCKEIENKKGPEELQLQEGDKEN